MTNENLEKFKNLLLKEKAGLEEKIKKLNDPDFGDDIDSLEEESDETEEMGTTIALSGSFSDRLSGINEALGKIDDGTYGICENCGKEISMELLEVDPESKLCKDCKSKNG